VLVSHPCHPTYWRKLLFMKAFRRGRPACHLYRQNEDTLPNTALRVRSVGGFPHAHPRRNPALGDRSCPRRPHPPPCPGTPARPESSGVPARCPALGRDAGLHPSPRRESAGDLVAADGARPPGLVRIAVWRAASTGSDRPATCPTALTIAPTLKCSPVRVASRRWIVAMGKRASSRNTAIRLTSRFPSRP